MMLEHCNTLCCSSLTCECFKLLEVNSWLVVLAELFEISQNWAQLWHFIHKSDEELPKPVLLEAPFNRSFPVRVRRIPGPSCNYHSDQNFYRPTKKYWDFLGCR